MRVILTTTALFIAVGLLGLHYAAAQQQQNGPSQNKPAPNVQVAEGTLTRLDPDLQALWIQGSDHTERMFVFTDQTEVKASDDSGQGLSGDSPALLRIYYENLDGVNTALEIEVLPSTPEGSVSL